MLGGRGGRLGSLPRQRPVAGAPVIHRRGRRPRRSSCRDPSLSAPAPMKGSGLAKERARLALPRCEMHIILLLHIARRCFDSGRAARGDSGPQAAGVGTRAAGPGLSHQELVDVVHLNQALLRGVVRHHLPDRPCSPRPSRGRLRGIVARRGCPPGPRGACAWGKSARGHAGTLPYVLILSANEAACAAGPGATAA